MAEEAPWTEFPLVSGLMIFGRPTQYRVARHSIESFFEQSWPNKELVIFNPTIVRLERRWGRRKVRELHLKYCDQWLMESICHAQADGEWCLNWRSDCIYDPGYIQAHMAQRAKTRMTICKNRQAYAINDQSTNVVVSGFPAWAFYRHVAVDFRKPYEEQFEIMFLDNPATLLTQIVSEIA